MLDEQRSCPEYLHYTLAAEKKEMIKTLKQKIKKGKNPFREKTVIKVCAVTFACNPDTVDSGLLHREEKERG